MNLLRHPAWGRAQETYGEDPLQVGVMAAAFTRGLQRHVMACMKHFALNSMENARFTVDVTVDERALHEVYLPHFERVAGEGVASVMSAYNSVNGEWCGENATLLTDILRDEWGWDGFVTSDFIFGLRDAAKSVRAGLDIEMPFRQQRAMWLADALESGDLDRETVELAVERIVATLLRFAYVFESQPPLSIVGNDDHRALAREAAVASMVLLRNDGQLLPVDPRGVGRVAVLGRLAAMRNLGDGGSSDVRASNVVTPLEGIRRAFVDSEVVHADADVVDRRWRRSGGRGRRVHQGRRGGVHRRRGHRRPGRRPVSPDGPSRARRRRAVRGARAVGSGRRRGSRRLGSSGRFRRRPHGARR